MSQLSKTEISKGYTLPKRKSKISFLLKQNKQVYCICQTSDTSRLMIKCDKYEDWYHCNCIGITIKQSKLIKYYFCDECKAKDPSLKIVFKTTLTRNKLKEKKYISVEIKRGNDHKRHRSKQKSCKNCDNCNQTKNCSLCSGCSKMRRFGGSDLCDNKKCLNIYSSIQGSKCLSKFKTKTKLKYSSSDDKPSIKQSQCYGPECTQKARVNSKYCSDECGINLATNRLFHRLPAIMAEWRLSLCVAEETNKKQLENVRKKQVEVQDVLKDLEEKLKVPDENEEMSMHCVTCGHEIHTKTAIKHMEKCFNKYESQSVFDSLYKTKIDGNNMFCDFYKPSERTYCKQFRVLCPIHNKDSTIRDTEWSKLDELVENEQQIRHNMSSRAGVLALILHSTYDHEVNERLADANNFQHLDENYLSAPSK